MSWGKGEEHTGGANELKVVRHRRVVHDGVCDHDCYWREMMCLSKRLKGVITRRSDSQLTPVTLSGPLDPRLARFQLSGDSRWACALIVM